MYSALSRFDGSNIKERTIMIIFSLGSLKKEIGREYKKIVRSKKTWGEIGEMQS